MQHDFPGSTGTTAGRPELFFFPSSVDLSTEHKLSFTECQINLLIVEFPGLAVFPTLAPAQLWVWRLSPCACAPQRSVAASRACKGMTKRAEKASASPRHPAFFGKQSLGKRAPWESIIQHRGAVWSGGLPPTHLRQLMPPLLLTFFCLSAPEFTEQQLPAPLPGWTPVFFLPTTTKARTEAVSTTTAVTAVAHPCYSMI